MNAMNRFLAFIENLIAKWYGNKLQEPINEPTMLIEPAPTPPNSPVQPVPTLHQFLTAQWEFENANPAINNPGNYRFHYGGYASMYGHVVCSAKGFAIFATLALGELYATNCTKGVIKNHPELTILTYIGGNGDWPGYAPASDNNPVNNYANFIASKLSVQPSFKMANLGGL